MIRLKRGRKIPKKLKDVASAKTDKLITAFESGKKIEPESDIYGHESVKTLLIELQHNKCAFCEVRLDQQFGNVEHFRPKKRIQPKRRAKSIVPGYFWLSYVWKNLSLVCEVCNIRYKRDYFPLKDESKRADPNQRNISDESPLLIDPYLMDPNRFLLFNEEEILAKKNHAIGLTTIDGFGLDSRELNEARRDRLAEVLLILDSVETIIEKGVPVPQRAASYLSEAVGPEGEFSAMIASNLGTRISEILGQIEELRT